MADCMTIEKVENRQWWMLGIFSVLACVGIAMAIFSFSARISRLEEKTNNLQNIIELYEKKNKELKEENEKYIKSTIDKSTIDLKGAQIVALNGDIYEG